MLDLYPTYAELDAAGYPPRPLWIDDWLRWAYASADRLKLTVVRKPTPQKPFVKRARRRKGVPPRVPASPYVGVQAYKRQAFAGYWFQDGIERHGPWHPRTDAGGRLAAQDRARALGRDYLERRDGSREPLASIAGVMLE